MVFTSASKENGQNFSNVKISRPFHKKNFKCWQMTSRSYKIIILALLAFFGAFGDFVAFLAPFLGFWRFLGIFGSTGDFFSTFKVLSHIRHKKVMWGHSKAKMFSFFQYSEKRHVRSHWWGLTSTQNIFLTKGKWFAHIGGYFYLISNLASQPLITTFLYSLP